MALSDSPSLFIPKKKQQFVLRTFSSPDIARAQTKYFPDSSFLFLFIFLLSFIRLTFSEKITHTCGGIIKDDYLTGVWILSAFHATFIKIHTFYSRLISWKRIIPVRHSYIGIEKIQRIFFYASIYEKFISLVNLSSIEIVNFFSLSYF